MLLSAVNTLKKKGAALLIEGSGWGEIVQT